MCNAEIGGDDEPGAPNVMAPKTMGMFVFVGGVILREVGIVLLNAALSD